MGESEQHEAAKKTVYGREGGEEAGQRRASSRITQDARVFPCQLLSIPMEIAQGKNTYRRLHKASCDRSVAYAMYLAMRYPGFVPRSTDREPPLPPTRLRKHLVERTNRARENERIARYSPVSRAYREQILPTRSRTRAREIVAEAGESRGGVSALRSRRVRISALAGQVSRQVEVN